MVAGTQVFRVLTEFKFEVGSAILGTQALQNKVDQLSGAAENTLISFQRLGIGIVAQFGLGAGGILGILSTAVQSSDKFRRSLLGFSTILALNKENIVGPVDTFNQRLLVSENIMKRINEVASKFALPSTALLKFTEILAPILLQKGLAGKNLEAAIDVSRSLLKAAPILFLDPGLIEGQLLRLIEGGASLGDPLFRRLVGETSTFKQEGIKGAKGFNVLATAKRFDLLRRALGEFANQSDEVAASTKTLNGQLTLLGDIIRGPFSLLKPIGEAVLIPLVKVLSGFNRFLRTEGAQIAGNLAKFIRPIIENPKELITNLLQVSDLSSDIRKGAAVTGLIGFILFLKQIPLLFGKIGPSIAKVLPRTLVTNIGLGATFIGTALGSLFIVIKAGAGTLLRAIFSFKVIGAVFGLLFTFISRVLPPLLAVVTLFQLISRARAIARIKDLMELPRIMATLITLFDRAKVAIGNFFSPFTEVFNAVAEFISPLFRLSNVANSVVGIFESLVNVFEFLGETMVLARATLEGFFFGILQFIENINAGKFFNLSEGIAEAFNAGIDSIIERNLRNLGEQGGAISQQITNIGKIEIKNEFREQLEPDRIAFTLKDQLLKAAQNPTQARGRSLNMGVASPVSGF